VYVVYVLHGVSVFVGIYVCRYGLYAYEKSSEILCGVIGKLEIDSCCFAYYEYKISMVCITVFLHWKILKYYVHDERNAISVVGECCHFMVRGTDVNNCCYWSSDIGIFSTPTMPS
jgi:hypothetical protein